MNPWRGGGGRDDCLDRDRRGLVPLSLLSSRRGAEKIILLFSNTSGYIGNASSLFSASSLLEAFS